MAVVICLGASVAVTRAGVAIGRAYLPFGAGYPGDSTPDLFRFDSAYYLDIARNGYAYDGDPNSSPNIVFAPLFPLAVRAVPVVDPVIAGFVLNFIFLALAVALSLAALSKWWGPSIAFWTIFAQVTAAGSFAFHAYYAESVTYLCISIALYAVATKRPAALAIAAAGLGAARAVGLVPAMVIALVHLRAGGGRGVGVGRILGLGALSLVGSVGYLGFLAYRFGNPFELLPTIQGASWRLYHPPTDWWRVVNLSYLFEYVTAAAARGFDVRVLNLAWTLLALLSIPFAFTPRLPRSVAWLFTAYAGAVYALDVSSEFLISAPRFFVLMTPIFLGAARLVAGLPRGWRRPVGLFVLLINAGFALWHAACFNQGWWFYF